MKRWLMWLLFFPVLLVACDSPFAPARPRIVVQWTTGSEFNTAGFNLYRSDVPTGPFTKINTQLIPASPDPVSGGKYEYEDTDVMAGKTYYYELEDIEYGGVTARHGPIVATASSPFPWAFGMILGGVALGGLIVLFLRLRLSKLSKF